MFRTYLILLLSKFAQWFLSLKGYGGSTFPGYLIEKLAPGDIGRVLKLLPGDVVVVTGTNGKTTTTKMIADMLRAEGKRVFTNDSGSNFIRGIISRIVKDSNWRFRPLDHDVAVLELDEAYGAQFVQYLRPSYVVALNILRDQLDRFGEIDLTATLIGAMLLQARKGCIINGNEPELVKIGESASAHVDYFAVDDHLRNLFPTDDELITIDRDIAASKKLPRAVELSEITGDRQAQYLIGGKKYTAQLSIPGIYNFQNAAAALTVVRRILPKVSAERWLQHLQTIGPAFGRGENVKIDGQNLEIVLVKNPAGFQQALLSYPDSAATMIAINDNYADGRDISWLWDVDTALLSSGTVAVVGGTRAYDMALRLKYDNIETGHIEESLVKALDYLLAHNSGPFRIFCNYTAMLALRAELARKIPLERLL